MAIRDPIAVYNAATNIEAVIIREVLVAAGIEAHVIEDVSMAGMWMFGLLPEIHKPQVWVDRSDVVRTKPLLEEYERRAAEGRDVEGEWCLVEATCEECGLPSQHSASRLGYVETCPHCGEYLDVGDCELDGWEEMGPASEDA